VSKPVIVFLTTAWADIDDRIRAGRQPGGVPSVTLIWKECLINGYEVHVFITTFLDRNWPRETIELDGVHFHWINMSCHKAVRWLQKRKLIGITRVFSILWQMKMWKRICESEIIPNIVYLMRPTFALVGWRWAKQVGAIIVLRQYGTRIYQFWGIEKNLIQRLRSLGEYWAMKMPMDLFIMTNDGSMGDKAARLCGIPVEKFRFWINGVNKNLRFINYNKQVGKFKLGLPKNAPIIMTLGRLVFPKRIDRIIAAFPQILKSFPKARLVIVGNGPLRQQLSDYAQHLCVETAVDFIGVVSHNEIGQYLNICDIFVMSNDYTNMGNTLIEALTCGCCIVTRNVGDTMIIAKNDLNSIVLDPGEPEQFAREIIELLGDKEKRKRLEENAYAWSMDNFLTWDERMAMEVHTLNELCRHKSSEKLI